MVLFFLFLPCPFHTILDLLISSSIFFLFSLSSNPTSFLLFYSTSSNITLLISQSFLSTLFIFPILLSSLLTLLPLQSSFPLPFSHLFATPLHTPSHLSCSPYFLLLVQNPSSYYSLLILSLSFTVFIIYVSSVFIYLYLYHLLSSSNLLDGSMDWTAQPLAFNSGQRKIIIIIIIIIITTIRQNEFFCKIERRK